MANWPDGRDIEEGSLQLGDELGRGGQGSVRRVLGWSGPLVYKRYTVTGADGAALAELVKLPATLSPADRDRLLRETAWPLARVVQGRQLTGFLMQAIPAQYLGPNGVGDTKERQLQYLLFEPKPMWGNIVPVQVTSVLRVSVATECIRLVYLMHGKGLVIGDVSLMNVLWTPGDPAEVFLIDCDGIRLAGACPVLPQAETPDWHDPLQGASGPDLDTDRYKLALLVGRVLSGSASLRPGQPLTLGPDIPDRIRTQTVALWQRASGSRGSRPDAWEWLQALTARAHIQLGPLPSVRQRPELKTVELEHKDPARPVIKLPPLP
jgi:DNA-binding helix-hairpin-helix protein with protein kinase domain